ncbi:Beta-D-glucosyl crocetin beta-1,6-glucosyltransferase [Sesamum alatum]|uniref:Beta-D-glucosyl crocetin beta-1,6-glucosyltransferase n=1 Tax=Sesamum alatum TaxID=300844 RepID=A0AAE2CTI9_9LAMI|nr:Beta-D-glucosyl crocetin beta-1,6-glucosyltransferase [Sesamum alatum]
MHAFQLSAPKFSDIITRLKPDLLIYDAFQPWSAKLASSHGIPAVHFAVVGTIAYSFFCHLLTHNSFDTFPYPAISLHEYEKQDLIAQGTSNKVQDPNQGFASGVLELSCDIVLTKSCGKGIDGKYMDYLSSFCQRRVLSVGSLIQENAAADHHETSTDSWIMNWLSTKSKSSTLYISFGSENYFSKEQIQEIAKGLELSKVNFIWVARSPAGRDDIINVEEALPEGFLDWAKERGVLVQEWAPQAAILASPAVGGFMSHCGWNSIVETVYFGVPVVAVPLKLDQPLHSRLVVEAGFGVEVVRDENGKFDGEGVGRAIDEVMLGESGETLRRRVRELSEKMKEEEEEAVRGVVEELSRLCMKKYSASS